MVDVLERLDRRRDGLLTVLTYHRVDEHVTRPDLDPALLSATPDEFARQMAYLAARRPVLTLDELLAVRRGERTLPPGAVMVTFDDAYRDFGRCAWPLIRGHGLPVTLFVPTGYPDRPGGAFWWDRLHQALHHAEAPPQVDTPLGRLALATAEDRATAKRRLRRWVEAAPHDQAMATVESLCRRLGAPPPAGQVLGWDELRRLAAEGVALAPHSRTHPMLDRLPLAQAQEEILGSMRDLEREIGAIAPAFSFPGGGHSEALVRWLPEAEIELAFTVRRGGNDVRRAEWTALRRINVGRRSSVPLVRVQLLSWLARPRRGTRVVSSR
jgi:peptidoglycan/xylan/chitin deacetylase (PgdA/CDA1 family)